MLDYWLTLISRVAEAIDQAQGRCTRLSRHETTNRNGLRIFTPCFFPDTA